MRETPYTSIHIDNMQKVTKAGAVIMPPVPAFYNKPQTIEEMVEYSVVRILDQFGVNIDHDKRWQ